jgi:hypothetical protein
VTWRVLLLAGAGLLLGLAAEWSTNRFIDPRDWIPDLTVGWTFIACGLIADGRRPSSRTGAPMVATGFTWFAGNFTSVEVEPLAWLSPGGAPGMRLSRIYPADILSLWPRS